MELNQIPSSAPQPKFNLWLITTIVLAVFLIAGGVVFAWQKSANNKVKNDLQSQINNLQNQVQQLTNTIPTDETADWKTYKNNEYGFEFKYPEKLTLRTDSSSYVEFIRKLSVKNCMGSPEFCTDYTFNPLLRFNFLEGDYVSYKEKYYNSNYSAEDIVVDGIKGFFYKIEQKEEFVNIEKGQGRISYVIPFRQFKNKDFVLGVDLIYIDESFVANYKGAKDFIPFEQQKQLVNKMLSTFKFSTKDQNTEAEIGYIKTIYTKNDKEYLDIDYIQFLGGVEAAKAAKEDGKCSPSESLSGCVPNNFYIRNQSAEIRTFEISKDIRISKIYMVDADAADYSPDGLKSINYGEFKSFWRNNPTDIHRKESPYNIEIKDSVITKITEQYIP